MSCCRRRKPIYLVKHYYTNICYSRETDLGEALKVITELNKHEEGAYYVEEIYY